MQTLTGTIPTRLLALWKKDGWLTQKADGRIALDQSLFGEVDRLLGLTPEMRLVDVEPAEFDGTLNNLWDAVVDFLIYDREGTYSWIEVKPGGQANPIV
jgi:hypothetical protein